MFVKRYKNNGANWALQWMSINTSSIESGEIFTFLPLFYFFFFILFIEWTTLDWFQEFLSEIPPDPPFIVLLLLAHKSHVYPQLPPLLNSKSILALILTQTTMLSSLRLICSLSAWAPLPHIRWAPCEQPRSLSATSKNTASWRECIHWELVSRRVTQPCWDFHTGENQLFCRI